MTVVPVALVAGGSRGLGLEIARQLHRRGHQVALCARDEAALQRAACSVQRAACSVRVRGTCIHPCHGRH
ncbi:SDR family NAD(P)-dependent oxidoreductase [Arachnia propionica]|uniref:SDR family NAD(P)-dependent oxidoreductase n=1 Tax=Arachnia propionica TaxID=1750 RepID=UPI003D15F2D6